MTRSEFFDNELHESLSGVFQVYSDYNYSIIIYPSVFTTTTFKSAAQGVVFSKEDLGKYLEGKNGGYISMPVDILGKGGTSRCSKLLSKLAVQIGRIAWGYSAMRVSCIISEDYPLYYGCVYIRHHHYLTSGPSSTGKKGGVGFYFMLHDNSATTWVSAPILNKSAKDVNPFFENGGQVDTYGVYVRSKIRNRALLTPMKLSDFGSHIYDSVRGIYGESGTIATYGIKLQ